MKAIVKFHENSIRVIMDSSKAEKKMSMAYIELECADIIKKLIEMKKIKPTVPEHEVRKWFDDLHEQIDTTFSNLQFAWTAT